MLFYLFEMVGSLLMHEDDHLEGSFGFEIFLRVIGYQELPRAQGESREEAAKRREEKAAADRVVVQKWEEEKAKRREERAKRRALYKLDPAGGALAD